MRAFLSHSSANKAYVEAVATALGRQWCVFDKRSFETGKDFRASIAEGLGDAHAFVLFASKESLESAWVDLEQNTAFMLSIQKHLKKALVFTLDGTEIGDLPAWLRQGLVRKAASAKTVAREIRDHLAKLMRDKREPYYVGRAKEYALLEQRLLPTDGSPTPRVFMLWGLPGIGRRSLAQKGATQLFDTARILDVPIESGDSLRDLSIKLADRLEFYTGTEGLNRIVDELQKLDEAQLRLRVAQQLLKAIEGRELPALIDAGGLITQHGQLTDVVREVVRLVDSNPELYLAIVSDRKAHDPLVAQRVAQVGVDSLTDDEVKRLLLLLAHREGFALTPVEATELAEYVSGYPPAAHYAARFIREYGPSVALADKSHLVDMRAGSFLTFLQRNIELTEARSRILAYLSVYSPLPLPVLGSALDLSPEILAKELSQLIDLALVVVDTGGHYRIATPIQDVINRRLGPIDVDHQRVADALRLHLNQAELESERLDLTRAAYRAFIRAGSASSDLIHLQSDVIRLLRDFYHSREFSRAVQWGREAVRIVPDDLEAREYFARALIQEEYWDEAQDQIDYIRTKALLKEADFLEGFLHRKRGDIARAITAYEESLKRGRRGSAVHRELALCFVEQMDYERAQKHIDEVKTSQSDNPFIVDLEAKIAIARGDLIGARAKVEQLRLVDGAGRYFHRLSTLEFAEGRHEAAYHAAEQAVAGIEHPPFEHLSQLIKTAIETGRLEEATKSCRRLERSHPRIRLDIRIGLQCKLEIRRGHFDNALALWNQLQDKQRAVHKALRMEALGGIVKQASTPDELRARYVAELEQLRNELGDRPRVEIEIR